MAHRSESRGTLTYKGRIAGEPRGRSSVASASHNPGGNVPNLVGVRTTALALALALADADADAGRHERLSFDAMVTRAEL